MDASRLTFPDKIFDMVFFSYNGLDYLFPHEKRMQCLQESRRVLKNEGVLVYSSHKKFYLSFPFQLIYPFVKIHYLKIIFSSFFAFNDFRIEKHPFGNLNTYCKNNSSHEPRAVGFKKVIKIDNSYNSYYVCSNET